MPDQDDAPKRSSKKARQPKTSGQLRAEAARASKKDEQPAKAVRPPDTRLLTCDQWARGRNDPITRAFVSEHARQKTVKRTPADWMQSYRGWLKQPRG